MTIDLTKLSSAGGCGCKASVGELRMLLGFMNDIKPNSHLHSGYKGFEDCVIQKYDNDKYLLSSLDFFSPPIGDPYKFGWVSAANAMGDIFAKGGTPISAMAILGYPEGIPLSAPKAILEGANDFCRSEGVTINGGHTIYNPQPIFGLSINGIVKKNELKSNSGSSPDEYIYLLKKVGTGIIANSLREKKLNLTSEVVKDFFDCLMRSNSIGVKLGKLPYVTTVTDVSGFGLLGHLLEVATASKINIIINTDKILKLTDFDLLCEEYETTGGKENWRIFKSEVTSNMCEKDRILTTDPQTNGGLLVFIKPESRSDFEIYLEENDLEQFSTPIGKTQEISSNIRININAS